MVRSSANRTSMSAEPFLAGRTSLIALAGVSLRLRSAGATAGMLLTALAVGCTGSPDDAAPEALPVLALSAAPTLEIGVLEGAEEYTFGAIASVLRLDDGSVAVSDGTASRISVFDPDGTFVRSFGGQGEGPGEFRALSRIYLRGDSVLAFDARGGRMSWFGVDGGYARQAAARTLTNDTTFALDVWLHGRYWVDGALETAQRTRVRNTLGRLPPPRSAPGYRYVWVTSAGDLWIREPAVDGRHRWTVVDAAGAPTAVVETPTGFEPHHLTDDDVLGRWRGESDVHFVRAYDLVDTGETAVAPAWMVGEASAASTEPPPDADAFRDLVRASIRGLAVAQEVHYSSAMTYTADLTDLEQFEAPDEVVIDVVNAGPRGWAAVFSHPRLDYVCGLGYGFTLPPGWVPGAIVCAPDPSETGASTAAGDL